MKCKSIIVSVLVASILLMTAGCKDEFKDLNTNPSSISEANVPYLFTQALMDFEPAGYLLWFYASRYTTRWAQSFVPAGGYTDRYNEMSENGGIGNQNVAVLKLKRDIDDYVSRLDAEEAAKYQNIQAMLNTLCVYLGIFDTDMFGSMPYSEACLARYGGTLTPKYDTMEELYTGWISDLDAAINVFSSGLADQISVTNQDIVYGGNTGRWLKFANGVKLKLAVRLLSQNKTKALQMAAEVGGNTAYVMNGSDDDFLYNKGSQNYHFGDDVSVMGRASKNVLDFMMKNRDPRLRFMFTKNSFNSEVVQAFFDDEADKIAEGIAVQSAIPKFILDNLEYDVVDGRKVFKAWTGLGEPWVRYYGLPVELGAANNEAYLGDYNYFNDTKWSVTVGTATKTYNPISSFQQEMVRGQIDFTYPTKPGGIVKQDLTDVPWYGMYLSTAEMNLYLAEMKLLGANLPKTAEEYFALAVESSVEVYDRLAGLNAIPYYDEEHLYDPNEKPIQLVAGEIETMMANEDYQLTGTTAEKIEKVYIQQFLHFMFQPIDQYTAVRRSGIPKVGSNLIPWVEMMSNTHIPRRFGVSEPLESDLMYSIIKAAYNDQGFTTGVNDARFLNSERIWSDKGAPNFGEGPNF